MKTSHAILVAAMIVLSSFVYAQIQFSDLTVQDTAGQPALVSTVVVSPVGTAEENGTALKAIYEAVAGATSGSPVLVKVEPGVYDLVVDNLDLLPYVNLEGSGPESTIIQSALNTTTAGVLDYAVAGRVEVSNLTVEHTGTGSGVGIYNDSEMFVDNVNVSLVGALSSNNFCVYNNSGYIRMRDCNLSSLAYDMSTTGKVAYGVYNITTTADKGEVDLFGTTILINGESAAFAVGAINIEGFVRLRHCMISAYDPSGPADSVYAIYGVVAGADGVVFAASTELYGLDGPYFESVPNAARGVHCWDGSLNPIADF